MDVKMMYLMVRVTVAMICMTRSHRTGAITSRKILKVIISTVMTTSVNTSPPPLGEDIRIGRLVRGGGNRLGNPMETNIRGAVQMAQMW